MMKSHRLASGLYGYRGWIIEKMEGGHWNMRPCSVTDWTDAAETLRDAKLMIDSWAK